MTPYNLASILKKIELCTIFYIMICGTAFVMLVFRPCQNIWVIKKSCFCKLYILILYTALSEKIKRNWYLLTKYQVNTNVFIKHAILRKMCDNNLKIYITEEVTRFWSCLYPILSLYYTMMSVWTLT